MNSTSMLCFESGKCCWFYSTDVWDEECKIDNISFYVRDDAIFLNDVKYSDEQYDECHRYIFILIKKVQVQTDWIGLKIQRSSIKLKNGFDLQMSWNYFNKELIVKNIKFFGDCAIVCIYGNR